MFIEYIGAGRSTRDKELLVSKVRAHAARWAYQKSLLERRNVQSTSRSNVRSKLKVEDDEADRSNSSKALSSALPTTPSADRKDGLSAFGPSLKANEMWQFNQIMLEEVNSPPQSYPVPLDSDRIRAIEYFPELWSRWAADVIPNRIERQAATEVAVARIVQRCLTDELHMTAFISYVLQRAPTANVSKVFLMQMAGKALSDLRSRIESGNASLEEVVWPIIFLAHYELFGSKSVWAGRAHLKAVVQLGGMEFLDEVTKVYIRRMDRGWWSDYPSIFPPQYFPRMKWESLVPEVSDKDSAGIGFFDYADILGSDLTNVLPFVVDCVRAGAICKDQMLQGAENETLQNTVIRRCQVLMDTLREWLPAAPERMACIYPAMIWLQYTTWVMRDLATKASLSIQVYRNVASHAHPNLLRCLEQSSQAHEMLLWAAAVGIATSSDEAVRVQYAIHELELAGTLGITDLRSSWTRYIWFENFAITDRKPILVALDKARELKPKSLDTAFGWDS